MNFLKALELKHFGKLDHQAVLDLAKQSSDFSNQWLVHAIRSECSFEELATAIAANLKWQTPALFVLADYLNSISLVNKNNTAIDEIKKLSDYTTKIFSDFCQETQIKLLNRFRDFSNLEYEGTALDDSKYTTNLMVSKAQINDILETCIPNLKDVSLFGGEGNNSKDESIRNNAHFPTPLPNTSMALALLEYSIAKAANEPIIFAEPPVILSYKSGQYYKWHYDHIFPHTREIESHIEQFGQRNKTAIFYFNEDFSGGETEFKEPFLSVKPEVGKVLIFNNTNEQGKRETSSIHRGNTIIEGEKLIMTLWFRNKPFWLRNGLL